MERVLCLVDSKWLWPVSIAKYGARVDFASLLRVVGDGRPTDGIIYLALNPTKDNTGFVKRLKRIGYTPKVQIFYESDGKSKNVDPFPAMVRDARALKDRYGIIAIVSGDARFRDLVSEMQDAGKRTEVYCFPDASDGPLMVRADAMHFLDEDVLCQP